MPDTAPVASVAKSPRRLPLFQPLRQKGFALFWVGEVVSRCGDEFQTIALATVAITLTGRSSALAGILMVQNLPMVLLLLFGGVMVDRFGAKRVMVATNTTLGVLAAGLVLLASRGPLAIAHLYVYAVLVGLVRPFFQPASFSMPPTLVSREQLPAANSLHRLGLDVSRIAAAPLAGVLVAAWGIAPAFALNAATFFQAAALQARIQLPQPLPSPQSGRPRALQQIAAGLNIIRQDPVLVGALAFTALAYLGFMGAYQVGIAGLAQITLQVGPKGQGILLGAFGAGNLLGTISAGATRNFGKVGRLILLHVLTPAGFVAAGLSASLTLSIAPLVLAGAAQAFVYVAVVVLIQSRAAPAVRGRVMAMMMLCAFGVYPLSYALAGFAASLWGPRGVLIGLGGVVGLLAAVIAYSIREFRDYQLDMR